MKRLLSYGAIYIFWGASFLAIRVIVGTVPPLLGAACRIFPAGALLIAWTLLRKEPQPKGREWLSLAVLGQIMFLICYGVLFWSEQSLDSGIAATIAATIPAWVFLLDWLWLRRFRPTLISLIGVAVGLASVSFLVLPAGITHNLAALDIHAAALACSAFVWAVGTVLSSRMPLPASKPVSAGWQMLFGGLGLMIAATLTGAWSHLSAAVLTLPNLVSMLYLILFASVLAFTAYQWLLAHEPAAHVASYAYINPVIALLIGTRLAHEALTQRQLIACGGVILGVLATLLGRRTSSRTKERPAEG